MAKERYSNEVIAQVLTQVVKNLQNDMDVQRKAMEEHTKNIKELLSKPIEVPPLNTQPLQELVKTMRTEGEALIIDRQESVKLLKQIDAIFQENTNRSIERLKKSNNFNWWSWRILGAGIGLILISALFISVEYFKMNQADIIKEQKKEIEKYKKFIEDTQNAKKAYENWMKIQGAHSRVGRRRRRCRRARIRTRPARHAGIGAETRLNPRFRRAGHASGSVEFKVKVRSLIGSLRMCIQEAEK